MNLRQKSDIWRIILETKKYWIAAQKGDFYLMWRMCLFSFG